MNQPKISDKSNLERVESLLALAFEAEQRDTEESLMHSNEALSIALKLGFKKQEARCYVRIGRCHWINGNFPLAVEFLSKALEISNHINEIHTKVDALIGLGNVYVTIQLLDQAIIHYNNALVFARNHGFGELESKILNNIGTMHEDLNDYQKALYFYQQSLKKAIEIEDHYGAAIANLNTGNVYFSLGKLDDSQTYIVNALIHAKNNNKNLLLAHGYHSMGRLHQARKNYIESIKCLTLGVQKANESKDTYILFKIYLELGITHDLMDQLKDAEHFFMVALDLATQMKMDELIPKVHEQMAFYHEKRNHHQLAYHHFNAYHKASKVVEENRRIERINSIEVQSKLSASLEETQIYRQLSNELKKSYQSMHILSTIGQTMTKTHELSDIFEQLYENANLLMPVECLGVGLYDEVNQALKFDLFIESNQMLESFSLSLTNQNSWSVWCFLNQKAVKINDVQKEYKKYINALASSRGELMHSAMYAPLMVEGEIIGVFSIQAKEKNRYSDTHQDLMQTLTSYLAIAIKNAMKTKQLAELNKQLKILSEKDGLTGVANRRLFDDMYDQLWTQAKKQKTPLVLMMVDIDNFKDFNDNYGHLTGDEVVKQVAQLLNQTKRSERDLVARYGGDEFVVLMPECNSDEAHQVAETMSHKIRSIHQNLGIKDKVTVSIGVAETTPNIDKTKEELISTADHQLYKSKTNGKNMISIINY